MRIEEIFSYTFPCSIQIYQIFGPDLLLFTSDFLIFPLNILLLDGPTLVHPGVESFRLIKADGQEVCCARGAGGEAGDLFKLALGGFLRLIVNT